MQPTIDIPLMANNITKDDLAVLISFLQTEPRLTQSSQVAAFEAKWSEWLGVPYSVYVNSGSSANYITIGALRHLYGGGEIIVPTLTWISDIASVFSHGFTPVFVDINPRNLCMNETEVIEKISDKTRAVFITYVQGFNGLSDRLLAVLKDRKIALIEDVCESHGATFKGRKLGSYGLASNFSYYFAHHMSTIEGGMVSTSDEAFYNSLLMFRSHGMLREMKCTGTKTRIAADNPDLSPDFIFPVASFNFRGTEIGGVLGLNQLKRLDQNNEVRRQNFRLFLDHLDTHKYRTDFDLDGSCNYAFNLILREKDEGLRENLEQTLRQEKIEFRRGSSGGGNQLRQPYLKKIVSPIDYERFPEVDHVHFFGYYIGNYPSLTEDKIKALCELVNKL